MTQEHRKSEYRWGDDIIIPRDHVTFFDGFAAPPAPPVRPDKALLSVAKLLANKEDTRQVFEIIHALSGGSTRRLFAKTLAAGYGRRLRTEPIRYEAILSDRECLRAMDHVSFGRAYLDFMEGQNLTADGILDAAGEAGLNVRCETDFREFQRLIIHLEVTHDLWHVLTGYQRDALGELCLLAFTRAQTGNPGFRMITAIGCLAMNAERPSVPVRKALAEGRRIGLDAAFLPATDLAALLPLPLDEARRRVNIATPEIYHGVPADIRARLLKPRLAKTQAQREAVSA